ncbi:hypothetical protein ES319_A07G162200v1 [Gossypium barbadense]|uniref:Sec23/Sec24 trunk domain-containing protein n=1 Tax=Gossypium barbadense TaxID=3634 RepID=A0A5J5V4F9_GOSBA|nr:hypothetical protein ES319_A07G162200v1 [Gossypium barbadense]
MIGLYFFGYNIGRIFGPEYLLRLFLAGAMSGSVFYLVHHAFLAKPLMLIVPDKQDIYTLLKQMLSSSFLRIQCHQHLEVLLENIPTMFQSSTTAESCFGAAIKVHIIHSLFNNFCINRLESCTKIL